MPLDGAAAVVPAAALVGGASGLPSGDNGSTSLAALLEGEVLLMFLSPLIGDSAIHKTHMLTFFSLKMGKVEYVTKDWGPKKVTIYFPIFYLVKSSKNILFFYQYFT